MIRRNLRRVAGPAMVLGAAVWVAIWAYWASLPAPAPGSVKPGGQLFDTLNVISIVLVLVGLTGAHQLQAEQTRRVGVSSVVLLWLGIALMGAWVVGLVDHYLVFTGGVLVLLVGLALFSFVSLRARVLPRTAVVPVIVALLLFPLMNPDDWRALIALPMGAAWAWLGYALWRLTATDSRDLTRTRAHDATA